MKKILIGVLIGLLIGVLGTYLFNSAKMALAEQSGGSPESGVTSRIKTLYDNLVVLGFGSDVDIPDWGAYWNRIKTAALWVPSGGAGVANVLTGQTFYNNSRTQQTGTMPDNEGDNASTAQTAAGGTNYLTAPEGYYDGNDRVSATDAQIAALAADLLGINIKEGNTIFGIAGTYPAPAACSTQQYHDSYGPPVTQTTNCTDNISWTDPGDAVTGTDLQDERTGLIWSYLLYRNGTVIEFSNSTDTFFSWNASHANNQGITAPVAGNRTATQLCADQGNGWRLPSQKELMLAYIDGSYWNLTQPSNYFWSATEFSAANAWYVYLSVGYTNFPAKGTALPVHCVR